MRYQILQPHSPFDVRRRYFADMAEFLRECPPYQDGRHYSEDEALLLSRGIYPAGVASMFPVVIARSTEWMVTMIDLPADEIDPEGFVPCSLIITALVECRADLARVYANEHFSMPRWYQRAASDPARRVTSHELAAAGSSYDPRPR
jgi:hypothetical protein